MDKHLPAEAGRDGSVQAHGDKHPVPVVGEVGVCEGPALPVHKDMAYILYANVVCQQLVALGYVQVHDHIQILGEVEADGCSAPFGFILVMGQVHVEGPCAGPLQLVAMAGGPQDAVLLVALPSIAWQHKPSDTGDPDGWQVAKDGAGQSHIMQGPGQSCSHACVLYGCQHSKPLLMNDCHKSLG